ncbi:hypothetical protein CONPUDRAFT_153112 [Coniophora puteana RWD-64-598 SS2]|uniref:Pkr1-domain-containing protein n=1 Tax=Coniophora puteana (strain RWD-64-598) TaxID=741705 RepID=A0A5M3MT13_CONPW|nr:uncharacterized protein CONPUDRAFT_153112 [Coniophora puteana RWD-64-598 SS2]EIW82230.1 hypothetical protein CONPUDRAFT_153112 [Coniophora puteana RWD-64-598 SS2]
MSAESTAQDAPQLNSEKQFDQDESFFSNILAPGSSLHPTFLAIVDGSLALLLVTFIAALYFTNGSIHFIVLIVIELALWATIKWFVNELKQVQEVDENSQEKKDQ